MKTIYTNGVIISLEDYSGNALVEENGKIKYWKLSGTL